MGLAYYMSIVLTCGRTLFKENGFSFFDTVCDIMDGVAVLVYCLVLGVLWI